MTIAAGATFSPAKCGQCDRAFARRSAACHQYFGRHHHSALGGAGYRRAGSLRTEHHAVRGGVDPRFRAVGPAARRLRRAQRYLVASLFFIAGAALCALAPSMPVMLAGRTVQGFGGGLIFALSYAMINTVFEQRLWPRAMALISAMWGIATGGAGGGRHFR